MKQCSLTFDRCKSFLEAYGVSVSPIFDKARMNYAYKH
jgi:hypothetical protein